MNNNLKNSYEVNYLHRIYSKLAWLVFSFTITTLIVILFMKHTSFNFPFIAVDAIMLICLAIAYSWQLVDLENSVNNTVTLPILYNSATGQVIVLTNPSK